MGNTYLFFEGVTLGFTLIAAIGPQNAFVLRQGLLRQHAFLAALFTPLSDTLLIALTILGIGKFLAESPLLKQCLTIGGVAFLGIYGTRSLLSAFKSNHLTLSKDKAITSRKKLFFQAIGFSWLNPHALLDVVVIMGSIAAQYGEEDARSFGLGCIAVSFMWFFALAYGAKSLSHYFQKPTTWKVIDASIAVMCFLIAFKLLKSFF